MTPTPLTKVNRIDSIDLLRGIVMIIMALDHVRDYFHADAFLYDPLDLEKTSVILFFTRWITHFCAPVFVFLAGTSIFLVGERKDKKELSIFLLKRGLWIAFLEFTVVNFAWFFNIHFTMNLVGVIWVIGISMVILAALIHLPKQIILIIGLVLVFGHNLLDGIRLEGSDWKAVVWSLLHQSNYFVFPTKNVFVAYPLLPWLGAMILGYCFGTLYTLDAVTRRKHLFRLGSAAVALFVIIRAINIYGDSSPWSVQSSAVFTFLSFIDISKYPPSLLYLLITIGLAILFLAFAERPLGKLNKAFVTIGRVPMFYYLLHIFLILGLALIAAMATGFGFSAMVGFETWINMETKLQGYGFNLWVTYVVWILVVLMLYPLCKWYEGYKRSHREKWWLSYI